MAETTGNEGKLGDLTMTTNTAASEMPFDPKRCPSNASVDPEITETVFQYLMKARCVSRLEVTRALEFALASRAASPAMPDAGEREPAPEVPCPACGRKWLARVDERKPDGHFRPGPDLRCVNCKTVFRDPVCIPDHAKPADTGAADTQADRREGMLAAALIETQSLLAAMLHEARSPDEIKVQMADNRRALAAAFLLPPAPGGSDDVK